MSRILAKYKRPTCWYMIYEFDYMVSIEIMITGLDGAYGNWAFWAKREGDNYVVRGARWNSTLRLLIDGKGIEWAGSDTDSKGCHLRFNKIIEQ